MVHSDSTGIIAIISISQERPMGIFSIPMGNSEYFGLSRVEEYGSAMSDSERLSYRVEQRIRSTTIMGI